MSDGDVTKHEIEARDTAFINSIILWRIYDALLLLVTLQDRDAAVKLTKLHEEGEFLGPNPAYRPEPQFIQPVGEQEEPGK